MFGTELFETGELTLSVIILFLELFTFRCEIRVLIRLGCFRHRVGVDAANSLLSASFSWTRQTREVSSDDAAGTPKIWPTRDRRLAAVAFRLSEIFLATSG